mmetsp:Transcript_22314/g.60949  ORF Transcript_22314/g.60949 Transcript_22314/m.60949 type:complete len:89 (-) Transcript_22314:20-286(-)
MIGERIVKVKDMAMRSLAPSDGGASPRGRVEPWSPSIGAGTLSNSLGMFGECVAEVEHMAGARATCTGAVHDGGASPECRRRALADYC